MKNSLPKVSFGFVHCNRLHYLKSCLESLLYCTEDYPNKEIIIVDNASVEEGTEDYLKEKEAQGFTVVRQAHRDPANEFARGLNIISQLAKGEFICPLQSDMQFIVRGGWLQKYVDFYTKHYDNIGCMTLDAQRDVTNIKRSPYGIAQGAQMHNNDYNFVFDVKRNPISGAADCFFSKKILDLIAPWDEHNEKHEGGGDSETKMLNKVKNIMSEKKLSLYAVSPMIPPAAAIYTDPRGTNARVRKNRRYGEYFAPKEDFKYYEVLEYADVVKKFNDSKIPIGLEKLVETIGYPKPIDENGNWLKNPINPDLALPSEYVELGTEEQVIQDIASESPVDAQWLNDWLED